MPISTRLRAGFTVAAVAGLALLGTATSALACTTDDDRAKPVEGNATTCVEAKVSGDLLGAGDLTVTGGTQKDKYLNVTAVGEGVTVTAIVVKGGPGYNVYVPGKRGMSATPPWEKLRSPFNRGEQLPTISHWFACGTKTAPTKPPVSETPTTTPSQPTSEAPTTSPGASATSSAPAGATSAPATTSAPAVVPAGNENGTGGGLANTGFDNAWLFWVGGVLIVGGGALLVLLKVRRRGTN
ncbi:MULTISPECIES: LPXTG cell wall anchor domain-containing protein [Amycolatopsis]|uniref:LPXTG cell wall anchor domain-containing protein n=1 Tax=Amycolatopsis dendrobii TaxID=2760662 RepID=A0A7W3VTM6_9PSEU|nr:MULTISPECIES: LPXTG cell wall anchor domain-containing protein [Amycolatopsis]MBB1152839.1 LPXTG cell wall anchor domain-containing protein [Amycolatopsis dendrobii]UKD51989.1 LPXTG cell wall anchor domain-containing protein [Amycolatopsis sp. FU40]